MASSLTLTEIASGDLPAAAPTGKGIMFLEESSGNPTLRNDAGVDTPMTPGGVNIFHEMLLIAESFVDQIPTGLDSTTQVTFGAAQGTVSDPVMIDAAGLVTINEDIDSLALRTLVSFGRTGGASVSELFFRSVINGVVYSTPLGVKIDSANITQIVFVSNDLALPAGTTISIEFVRDPSGHNSGQLIALTPTAAGWNDTAASANIVISRTVAS